MPIIETGLSDGKLSHERAALMASFCEWAAAIKANDNDEIRLVESINQRLIRLRARLSQSQ